MKLLSKARAALVGLVLSLIVGSSQARADALEKIAAGPPAAVAGANLLGMSVSDLTSWAMFIYALLLIGWHLKTKWFARKPAEGGDA